MKKPEKTTGKLTERSKGLGTVTKAMVEKRAKELAAIGRRPGRSVSQAERQTADEELEEVTDPKAPEVPDPVVEIVKPWDGPPALGGRRVKSRGPEDEQQATARLVERGVEEAEDDRMLAAAKQQRKRERR